MLALYLFSAIVGLIVLVASSTMGHHDTGDADGDDVWGWFSLRALTYFLAFFGLTGTALHYLVEQQEWVKLVAAAGTGVVSAALARVVLSSAITGTTGTIGTSHLSDHVGKEAKVLIDVAAGSTGQVRIQMPDGTADVLATSSDETLTSGMRVVVVEAQSDRVVVAAHPIKG